MKIKAVKANPAGNTTLLVITSVAPELRAAVSVELLKKTDCEQVGFLVPPIRGGDVRLEMMGGEFCGNALRSAGFYAAQYKPGKTRILAEISGYDGCLEVSVDREAQFATAQMPFPIQICNCGEYQTAVFDGIAHAVTDDSSSCTPEKTMQMIRTILRKTRTAAAGIMFLNRETFQMRPAVYVSDTDTLYFESSCASGSAAAAVLLSEQTPNCSVKYQFRQPGGTLFATIERSDGKITALSIGGIITLESEREWEVSK